MKKMKKGCPKLYCYWSMSEFVLFTKVWGHTLTLQIKLVILHVPHRTTTTIAQPHAEPPAAEGCGPCHQDDIKDAEEGDDPPCGSNTVTPIISRVSHVKNRVLFHRKLPMNACLCAISDLQLPGSTAGRLSRTLHPWLTPDGQADHWHQLKGEKHFLGFVSQTDWIVKPLENEKNKRQTHNSKCRLKM